MTVKWNKRIGDLYRERLRIARNRLKESAEASVAILDDEGAPLEGCGFSTEYAELEKVCRAIDWRAAEPGIRMLDPEMAGQDVAAQPVFCGSRLICVWILYGFCYIPDKKAAIEEGKATFNDASLKLVSSLATILSDDIIRQLHHNQQLTWMEEAIRESSFLDPLMGLPNFLGLERDIHNKAYQWLLVVDVQDLRKINEVYGRECGDLLLMALRDYLEGMQEGRYPLYRLDAADFAVLLPEMEKEQVGGLAQGLLERCRSPWVVTISGQQASIYISVRIGVLYLYGEKNAVSKDLSGAIEYVLDLSRKAEGIAFFEDEANRAFHNRMKLEMDLRGCVRDNMRNFSVNYQPIVDPGIGKWSGVEVLLRWHSDTFGKVSPEQFIPILEAAGLIGVVGLWVLEQSITQAKAWKLDEVEGFLLHVNLSPLQLTDLRLDAAIMEVLEKAEYPPEKLCLEITESSEMSFALHTIMVIERLRAKNIMIALDDFGTGYASLSQLHRLPIGILKADRSLVEGMEEDEFLQSLFRVMVEIAHASNMEIVAEGVETVQQAKQLLRQGADYMQGYHFAYPLTAEEMEGSLPYFHHPCQQLVEMGYGRMDMGQLAGHTGYDLAPWMYKLFHGCMRAVFTNPDAGKSIDIALSQIGEGLRVDRSYVFLREKNGTFTNTHEWCSPGTPPEIDQLQRIQVSPSWLEILERDGVLRSSDLSTLDPQAKKDLEGQGIQAVLVFPIWRKGKLHGFVGFDHCRNNHVWSREEIQMLHTLTGIIASVLVQEDLRQHILIQNKRMESMLDGMDTLIYVSDLDTGKILFANTAWKEALGTADLVGKFCWEALYGKGARCEDCPRERLLAAPEKLCSREHYDEKRAVYYRAQDSLITWEEGKYALFECAHNVTETKQYQLRLETYASTDVLTGLLNRSSFMHESRVALEQAHEQEIISTIAFVDIDNLKTENDRFGHAAGDELIRRIMEAITRNVRRSDIVGRYGGDEFVVLFSDCSPNHAASRLNMAQHELAMGEKADRYSFSYGLVSNQELPYSTDFDYLEKLLNIADWRMMRNKQGKKIGRQG